ncbi:ATP-binding protein [Streptomyces sp. A3M-1-3]|uniref:ATP-binding protein n=1 Tax=Streptomyces sp. A3M-1-3 TaxID=2962044 RepID=UPI0020B7FAAB|nr:ATP-binding protein [Streptomyces sp. A3M-1-3]MCP3822387.1 ATP-binding protein [Streptomyces sp. A3M-1-3]
MTTPNAATASKIARDFVTSVLRTAEHPQLVDAATLCTSEVVTNAHLHTGTERIVIEVSVGRDYVIVRVRDDCTPPNPVPADCYSREGHGRGLRLVGAYADEWGSSETGARSKTVWFKLVENGRGAA